MAGSFNKVHILGNLGADPELRYTQNQVPVATLSVATTEYRKTADGTPQNITEWHRVVVWNKQAENCQKYLKKGRTVFIEGRLQTRSWEDQSGVKKYTTEIVAQNVQFVGGGGQGDMMGDSMSQQQYAPHGQGPSQPSQNNAFDMNSASVPELDDIPF